MEGHAMHHEAASMKAADAVEADVLKAGAVKAHAVEAEAVKARAAKACAVKASAVKATAAPGGDFRLSNQSASQDRNSGNGSLAHHLFAQSIAGRRSRRLRNYTS
jgi:hypothetical protein